MMLVDTVDSPMSRKVAVDQIRYSAPASITGCSCVYRDMICRENRTLAKVKARASSTPDRRATVMTFFRENRSWDPQNREVSTEAPILTPMHKNVNRVMNWLAREEADNAVSPRLPSMMVSTRFTPVVMTLCMATGRAIFTTSL